MLSGYMRKVGVAFLATPLSEKRRITSSSNSKTCCSSSPILAFFLSLAVCAATLFLSFLEKKWVKGGEGKKERKKKEI